MIVYLQANSRDPDMIDMWYEFYPTKNTFRTDSQLMGVLHIDQLDDLQIREVLRADSKVEVKLSVQQVISDD
jgi:hypothetical protein